VDYIKKEIKDNLKVIVPIRIYLKNQIKQIEIIKRNKKDLIKKAREINKLKLPKKKSI